MFKPITLEMYDPAVNLNHQNLPIIFDQTGSKYLVAPLYSRIELQEQENIINQSLIELAYQDGLEPIELPLAQVAPVQIRCSVPAIGVKKVYLLRQNQTYKWFYDVLEPKLFALKWYFEEVCKTKLKIKRLANYWLLQGEHKYLIEFDSSPSQTLVYSSNFVMPPAKDAEIDRIISNLDDFSRQLKRGDYVSNWQVFVASDFQISHRDLLMSVLAFYFEQTNSLVEPKILKLVQINPNVITLSGLTCNNHRWKLELNCNTWKPDLAAWALTE